MSKYWYLERKFLSSIDSRMSSGRMRKRAVSHSPDKTYNWRKSWFFCWRSEARRCLLKICKIHFTITERGREKREKKMHVEKYEKWIKYLYLIKSYQCKGKHHSCVDLHVVALMLILWLWKLHGKGKGIEQEEREKKKISRKNIGEMKLLNNRHQSSRKRS